jgi:hypothetical protein
MPRLTAEQWNEIRQRREAGETFRSLADAFGISDPAICKRAKAELWGDGLDLGSAIRQRVQEKVNGVVNGANPEETEAAIEAAATTGADLISRQQGDWELHRSRFGPVAATLDDAKHAEASARALSLLHAGERKSHGLSDSALPLADAETESAQKARTQTAMIAINSLLSQIVIEKHGNG